MEVVIVMKVRIQKPIKYLWLLGFLGLQGFKYFKTGEPLALFWFSYFSFFAYCFIGQMADEMQDERYFVNSQRAKLKTAKIHLMTLFTIGLFSGFSFVTKEVILVICALGWAGTLISYFYLFWHYDQD